MKDDMREVVVGSEVWKYEAFWDDPSRDSAVKLYDENGEYVTEFFTREDMWDYLSDPIGSRVAALKAIRQFRREKDRIKEKAKGEDDVRVQRDGTPELRAVFIKRFQMIRGDMSVYELGDVLGMNYATVNNYATGSRFPGGAALKRIADRCGVSVDWLLGRDE